jgi:DNA topoisomerase I
MLNGNTPTICRKCYVHLEIVSANLDGGLLREIQKEIDDQLRDDLETLQPEEAAVAASPQTARPKPHHRTAAARAATSPRRAGQSSTWAAAA